LVGAWRADGLACTVSNLINPRDDYNPFAWNSIRLNLPGTADYNPKLPWMLKIQKDGLAASDIAQYVDDVRILAPIEKLAWLCSTARWQRGWIF